MAKAQKVVLSPEEKAEAKQKRWAQIKRDKWMYLLLLPGFLYFIIFKIVPMWGILISFKDYYAGIPFFGSNFFNGWIGFDNFKNFFTDSSFLQLLRNTLIISGMNIIMKSKYNGIRKFFKHLFMYLTLYQWLSSHLSHSCLLRLRQWRV